MRDTLILLAVFAAMWAPALVALVWLWRLAKEEAQRAATLEQHAAHLAEHCQRDAQHRVVMDGVLMALKLQDRQIRAQDEQIQALHREAAAREEERPWLS